MSKSLEFDENYYFNLLNNIPIGVFRSTIEGNIVSCNRHMIKIYGYENEADVLHVMADNFYTDKKDREKIIKTLEIDELLTDHITLEYKKDGSKIWVSTDYKAIKDNKGRIKYIDGTVQDITETKIKEDIEKERIKRINKESEIISLIANSKNLITGEINQLVKEITEKSSEALKVERVGVWLFNATAEILREIDNYNLRINIHQSGSELLENEFKEEFEALKNSKYIEANEAQNDKRLRGYLDSYLIPNKITSMLDAVIRLGDKILGTICFEHVETKHIWQEDEISFACQLADQMAIAIANKEKEDAINEIKLNKYYLEKAQEIGKIGTWEIDVKENKIYWTKQNYMNFNLEEGTEITYDLFINLIHPEDKEYIASRWQDALKGEEYDVEHRIIVDGEERWLREKAELYFGEEGLVNKATGLTQDITEQKRAEKSFQLSSKLESIGTIAGGIAHDFNNLLGGIFGNIELARITSKNERVKSYLNKTIETIERAQNLTSQLLTFTKGGEPIKRVEDISNLLKRVTEFTLSGSPVNCKFEISENLHPSNVDKHQISQVIDNIVINALQAMGERGELIVEAKNVSIKSKSDLMLPKGEYIKISIKDNGPGIPEEVLPKVFEPFFSTKNTGSGIGLYTSYSIIKKHNGIIDVKTSKGNGTTFVIYLPAHEGKIEQRINHKIDYHEGSGYFIIMDDVEDIRDTISDMLELFGYDVIKMNKGEDTLSFFKEQIAKNSKVAGMIFDLTIPGGMGGKETIKLVREIDSRVPVFVSSGYADDPVMANPKEYGFTESIVKPFRLKELIEVLNKYIE